jgi:starvation-inducible DNA-binding protein
MNLITGSAEKQECNIAGVLKRLLADEFIPYAKTRECHWNAVGPRSHDSRKLFETQYEALAEIIDDVAKRVESLDKQTLAALPELLDLTTLNDQPDIALGDVEMLADLLGDHRSDISLLGADLNIYNEKCPDAETSDFLTGVMKKHEELAWILSALLEEQPARLALNNFQPRHRNIQTLN